MTLVDQKTARDLHLRVLLDALVERCPSEPGKTAMRALAPAESTGERRMRALRVEQARACLARDQRPGFSGLTDLGAVATRARKGAVLEPEELLGVRDAAHAVGNVRQTLAACADFAPLLAADAAALPRLGDLAWQIDATFEPSGRIRDDATSELEKLRSRARSLHSSLRRRADEMLSEPETEEALQDRFYTQRNERYVLPVRTDRRAMLKGIIHGTSNSGQTVFIEPDELVVPNNELKLVESAAAEEELANLRSLSADVRDLADALEQGVTGAAEIEIFFAAADLAEAHDLHPAEEGADPADIELKAARNPVLLLSPDPRNRGVVSNDLCFPEGVRWLVVSGPNAGGKSVTLNTVGTFAWMHACGLPLPVEPPSKMPFFTGIAALFGDAQDIEADLSTFTGHLKRLKEILDTTGEGGLVLVDEIVDGTDPEQAAALAQAILEEAAEAGLVGAVSTHYPRLKRLSEEDPRFANARVLFDAARARPTYHLEIGAAAESEPLAIARQAGLAESILIRARDLCGAGFDALEQLRGEAEAARADAERRREEAERARAEATREREEVAEERRLIKEEAKERIAAVAARALERIDSAVREVRELVRRLQIQPDADGARRSRRRLDELAKDVKEARDEGVAAVEPEPPAPEEPEGEPVTPEPGDRVYVPSLDRDADVLAIRGDQMVVQAGGLHMTVPRSSARRAQDAKPLEGSVRFEPGEGALPFDLDLRGLRVDEALDRLDQALDQATLRGRGELRVIHGHGTNALRMAVRKHLSESAYVERHASEPRRAGGEGATHVWLR